MIYAAIFLALIVGFAAGYASCKFIKEAEFKRLFDDGQIICRTEDGWQGSGDALRSVVMSNRIPVDFIVSPGNPQDSYPAPKR
jgi:hypothetical protein